MPAVLPSARYQMVWGHWGQTSAGNDLGLAFAEAMSGREITVGNLAAGLFRDNTSALAMPLTGRADFVMRTGQVDLLATTPLGVVNSGAGSIQSATLNVAFDTRTFATQLVLQHPALTTAATLNAYGMLRDDGMLYSLTRLSNGSVQGALSRDGIEAGYQFSLPVTSGTLAGTTLWVK